MGLDITVLTVDWAWLAEAPPGERLSRLRSAWYDDETGLWELDATPQDEGEWVWPPGPGGGCFGIYEFRRTLGSFKAHFWAGERWESLRAHADPLMRVELDSLLRGLIWGGLDGEAEHIDSGLSSDDPRVAYGLLVAKTPDTTRELAATWERVRPRLGELREAFTAHAAQPGAWIGDFDEFSDLLEDWGRVLTEAATRGWCVVGLSE
ncbi:hypothetical protein ACQB60_10155 [Actinomycetota bacterium Odt1-20B]